MSKMSELNYVTQLRQHLGLPPSSTPGSRHLLQARAMQVNRGKGRKNGGKRSKPSGRGSEAQAKAQAVLKAARGRPRQSGAGRDLKAGDVHI